MLIPAIVSRHAIHSGTAIHPLHLKMILELVLMCWLLAVLTLAAARSDDAARTSVDAGFYDLQRAHSERAIVFFGHAISFKKYVLVKILDQYVIVQQDSPGGEYTEKSDGKTKTIVIY